MSVGAAAPNIRRMVADDCQENLRVVDHQKDSSSLERVTTTKETESHGIPHTTHANGGEPNSAHRDSMSGPEISVYLHTTNETNELTTNQEGEHLQ